MVRITLLRHHLVINSGQDGSAKIIVKRAVRMEVCFLLIYCILFAAAITLLIYGPESYISRQLYYSMMFSRISVPAILTYCSMADWYDRRKIMDELYS